MLGPFAARNVVPNGIRRMGSPGRWQVGRAHARLTHTLLPGELSPLTTGPVARRFVAACPRAELATHATSTRLIASMDVCRRRTETDSSC
jgi:hypothetical protein